MIKTVTTTTLRNNFKDSIDHIKKSKRPLIITDRDIPTAILIDIDEYEDIALAKDKAFIASIKKSRSEYKAGKVFGLQDVFADVI